MPLISGDSFQRAIEIGRNKQTSPKENQRTRNVTLIAGIVFEENLKNCCSEKRDKTSILSSEGSISSQDSLVGLIINTSDRKPDVDSTVLGRETSRKKLTLQVRSISQTNTREPKEHEEKKLQLKSIVSKKKKVDKDKYASFEEASRLTLYPTTKASVVYRRKPALGEKPSKSVAETLKRKSTLLSGATYEDILNQFRAKSRENTTGISCQISGQSFERSLGQGARNYQGRSQENPILRRKSTLISGSAFERITQPRPKSFAFDFEDIVKHNSQFKSISFLSWKQFENKVLVTERPRFSYWDHPQRLRRNSKRISTGTLEDHFRPKFKTRPVSIISGQDFETKVLRRQKTNYWENPPRVQRNSKLFTADDFENNVSIKQLETEDPWNTYPTISRNSKLISAETLENAYKTQLDEKRLSQLFPKSAHDTILVTGEEADDIIQEVVFEANPELENDFYDFLASRPERNTILISGSEFEDHISSPVDLAMAYSKRYSAGVTWERRKQINTEDGKNTNGEVAVEKSYQSEVSKITEPVHLTDFKYTLSTTALKPRRRNSLTRRPQSFMLKEAKEKYRHSIPVRLVEESKETVGSAKVDIKESINSLRKSFREKLQRQDSGKGKRQRTGGTRIRDISYYWGNQKRPGTEKETDSQSDSQVDQTKTDVPPAKKTPFKFEVVDPHGSGKPFFGDPEKIKRETMRVSGRVARDMKKGADRLDQGLLRASDKFDLAGQKILYGVENIAENVKQSAHNIERSATTGNQSLKERFNRFSREKHVSFHGGESKHGLAKSIGKKENAIGKVGNSLSPVGGSVANEIVVAEMHEETAQDIKMTKINEDLKVGGVDRIDVVIEKMPTKNIIRRKILQDSVKVGDHEAGYKTTEVPKRASQRIKEKSEIVQKEIKENSHEIGNKISTGGSLVKDALVAATRITGKTIEYGLTQTENLVMGAVDDEPFPKERSRQEFRHKEQKHDPSVSIDDLRQEIRRAREQLAAKTSMIRERSTSREREKRLAKQRVAEEYRAQLSKRGEKKNDNIERGRSRKREDITGNTRNEKRIDYTPNGYKETQM